MEVAWAEDEPGSDEDEAGMLAEFPLDEPLLVACEVTDPTEDDDDKTADDGLEALLDSGPDEDRPPLLEDAPPEDELARDWADDDTSGLLLLDERNNELLPREPPDAVEPLLVLELLELDWDTGTPWSEQKFPSVPCMQR